MKESTRGAIEKALDEFLENEEEAVKGVEWVERDMPITSMKELALGYAIGFFMAFSTSIVAIMEGARSLSKEAMNKEEEQLRAMIRRRLPEILECIESQLGK